MTSQETAAGAPRPGVAQIFDGLAPDYDQAGVAWFGPIAARLVELLAPQPGERALDIGAGRGAVTFPLSDAVGPSGQVTAIDISAEMIRLLGQDAATRGVANLRAAHGEATAASLGEADFDVAAASLVLFFCPDPEATLRQWLGLVRPGGRLGITTFGPQDEIWRRVDSVFEPYLPQQLLDARTSGRRGPFASSEALVSLFEQCGAVGITSQEEPVEVALPDADAWRRWSMTLGQRQMWAAVPADQQDGVFHQAAETLEQARGADGLIHLSQQVRYTLCRVA